MPLKRPSCQVNLHRAKRQKVLRLSKSYRYIFFFFTSCNKTYRKNRQICTCNLQLFQLNPCASLEPFMFTFQH